MSWPTGQDLSGRDRGGQDKRSTDVVRPAAPAKPPMWKAWAIDYAANSPVTGLAATAAVVAPSTLTIAATLAGLIGTGVKTVTDRVKKDAEAKAVAERDAANRPPPAPRVTASGAGVLGDAHLTVGAALTVIGKADQRAESVYDGLKASRERLAGRLGGGDQVPAELQEAYDRNEQACELLEEVHQELNEAAAALQRFVVGTLHIQ